LSTTFLLLRVASNQKPANLSVDRLTFFVRTSYVVAGVITSGGEAILTRTSSVVNHFVQAAGGTGAEDTPAALAAAEASAALRA
jgi:hypothetical protein